jgi:geranylgeranyl pyrophosphate synthase
MTICPVSTTPTTRRGKPTVHRAFSEPLAVLTGDSLIILAFEVLARAARHRSGPGRRTDADTGAM